MKCRRAARQSVTYVRPRHWIAVSYLDPGARYYPGRGRETGLKMRACSYPSRPPESRLQSKAAIEQPDNQPSRDESRRHRNTHDDDAADDATSDWRRGRVAAVPADGEE